MALAETGLLLSLDHGRRNVSKSGTARVEKRAQQARGSRRQRRLEGEVWGGVPPPQPTRGLWERREPQQGPGRSPGRQRFLAYFRATERCWWRFI